MAGSGLAKVTGSGVSHSMYSDVCPDCALRRDQGAIPMNSVRAVPIHQPALLAGLDQQTVLSIMAQGQARQVKAGQTLQNAGQPGTHLFLLRKGRARYYNTTESGQEISLYVLAPGDAFGLVALLDRSMTYMASADALSDCEFMAWRHESIRDLAKAHPQISENAMQISLRYLKEYVDRHARLISGTAKRRLGVTLLDLARRTGSVRPHGVEIDITNEQLGSLSDISRFTTSRLLSSWERSGAVSKSRGRIILHSPEALTNA